ncbi:MAG: metallophosphoesterase [Oscillospiraceae bacterium]|nr:metallophosphoesterase [Oscillospiraceae bacterium]
MKILVMSDSHGNIQNMLTAVVSETPDMILHLGDHHTDCRELRQRFPEIPLRAVKGNCDRAGELETEEFICEYLRIMMVHGHRFNVKYSLDSLVTNAMYNEVDILLYGHTHVAHTQEFEGMYIINPGSVGASRATYCVLELDSGKVSYEIKSL